MKIKDDRQSNKMIRFKDLEVGRTFEHVRLKMVLIKLDEFTKVDKFGDASKRNALRLDDGELPAELWCIAEESMVIPLNAKLIAY